MKYQTAVCYFYYLNLKKSLAERPLRGRSIMTNTKRVMRTANVDEAAASKRLKAMSYLPLVFNELMK